MTYTIEDWWKLQKEIHDAAHRGERPTYTRERWLGCLKARQAWLKETEEMIMDDHRNKVTHTKSTEIDEPTRQQIWKTGLHDLVQEAVENLRQQDINRIAEIMSPDSPWSIGEWALGRLVYEIAEDNVDEVR